MATEAAGSPMGGLRWMRRSPARLAAQLTREGLAISASTVCRLLQQHRFSLRVLEFRLFRAIWFTFFLTDGRSVSHTHSLANRDADGNRNP